MEATTKAFDTKRLKKDEKDVSSYKELRLSKNPERAVEEMMGTIDQLHQLYVEETDALEKVDLQRFISMQDKKVNVAKDYQQGMAELIQRKEEIQALDPEIKQKFREMQQEFSSLTQVNLEALEKMQKSTRRLCERIMDAARDAVQEDALQYSAKGGLEKNTKSVSVSVNESA